MGGLGGRTQRAYLGVSVKRLLLLTLLVLALAPRSTVAQQLGGAATIRAADASTGVSHNVGDSTNNALRINLVGTNSIRVQDGSGNALTSLSVGAQRAITVAVVDASGSQITAFGGAGGTASNFGSAFPTAGTAIGGSDGTNMQGFRVFDVDSGGGTQYAQGVNLRRSAAGGSSELLGQTTMTLSLPVTLASDQSALAVAQSGGWSVRAQDGSGNNLTSFSLGAQRSITVAVVDGSGTQITSFGGAGGTASNFGSAFPTSGTAVGFTDGTNMQGARVVDADTGAGTYYAVTTNLVRRVSGTPTELIGSSTSATSIPVVIASDQAAVAVSLASITTSVTPGTGATNLGKAEDAVVASGDVGVAFLLQREDTPTSTAAAGDYIQAKADLVGKLHTNPFPGAPAATQYLPVRFTDGTSFVTLGPDYTHDVALTVSSTAGPMTILRARAATPTDVSADDDAVVAWALRNGSQVMNIATGGTLITGTGTSLNMFCTGGCSGGTQYAEDSVGADADTVTLAGAHRQDTLASNTSADGDRTYLKVTSLGSLYVSGTIAEDTAHANADYGSPSLWRRCDSPSLSVTTDNDYGVPCMTGTGRVWTAADLSTIGGLGFPLEDAAETAGLAGIYAFGVRRDTAASSAGTSGDNTMASYDALGRIWARDGGPCGDWSRLTSAAINTAAAGNVEVVALNGSDLIYVCGYSIVVDAAVDVQFIYGTGTACATGETDITGIWGLAANGGITQANGGAIQFGAVPAGNALCIENSAAVQVSGHVAYVRTATP